MATAREWLVFRAAGSESGPVDASQAVCLCVLASSTSIGVGATLYQSAFPTHPESGLHQLLSTLLPTIVETLFRLSTSSALTRYRQVVAPFPRTFAPFVAWRAVRLV